MKYLLILLGLFSICIVEAQNFTVTPTQLSFGTVTELSADSLPVTLQNNSIQTITVTGYRFYSTYGQPAFSCITAYPVIQAGSSAVIYIRFLPRHNILHNSELLIENTGERGALRVDLNGQGHYSNSYYNASENTEQEALKLALKNITGNGYVNLVYGPARDSMFMLIDNEAVNGQGATQNTIECVYTGRKAVGYSDRTDCQTNFSFNTEHTFPQGFFNSLEPMRSDLHHLYPTDDLANNTRGSLPFGMVSNPTWSQGGSKGNSSMFEPRDLHKGKAARAMLYFLLRYQNYSNFVTTANENILKQWHQQFLPSVVESNRNDHIFISQNNRNPFIDYPQFSERINSYISTSIAATVSSVDLENDSINFGLLNAANQEYYRYWIINNGNSPVTFSNFNITNPILFSFANNTGTPVTLQPGEATNIDIQNANSPMGFMQTTLTFTRSGGSPANYSIPITAHLTFTGIAENTNSKMEVFPNPFTDQLCVTGGVISKLKLSDLTGRYVMDIESDCIQNATLSPGIYILSITTPAGTVNKRVVRN